MTTAVNAFDCGGNKTAATGVKCIPDIGAPAKAFLTVLDLEYATVDEANDIEKQNENVAALKAFPLPLIDEYSDNSEEDSRYTSPITKLQRKTSLGKTIHQYMLPFDPVLHANLQAFDGSNMRYYYADVNNNMTGTQPSGTTKWKGFEVRVDLGKWTTPADGDSVAHTPITITYVSNLEREKDIAIFPTDMNIKGVDGVFAANLEVVGTPTATEIVVNVKCGNTPITGLTLPTEFFFLEADGITEEVISGVAESATIPGQYTLTATAFTTLGTLTLGTASNPVVTIGTAYYMSDAITITIA